MPPRQKRVLIIDDDEVLRVLLVRVLDAAGYAPFESPGIKEAIKTLETTSPDLVVLDLNMPEHDGFTFLKLRRQSKLLANIPVMVLSGSKKKTDILKALELGADQFLHKPFETRLILQKLRYLLSRKENIAYRFPQEEELTVEVEIAGEIAEQCIGRLKLECPVQFLPGKSVKIDSEDYAKNKGSPFIGVVEKHITDLHEGMFRTPVAITGLSVESKALMEAWSRSLSE